MKCIQQMLTCSGKESVLNVLNVWQGMDCKPPLLILEVESETVNVGPSFCDFSPVVRLFDPLHSCIVVLTLAGVAESARKRMDGWM